MKRSINGLLVSLIISLLLFGVSYADGTVVAKIEDIEYSTIEDAMDAASTGNTIQLMADVTLADSYTISSRNFSIDGTKDEGETWTLTVPADKTISVTFGAELDLKNLILDGGTITESEPKVLAITPLLSASKDAMIALDNVVVQNRIITDDTTVPYSSLGILAVIYESEIRMTGCTISKIDNSLTGNTPFFFMQNKSSINISDCEFSGNNAGGAALIDAKESTISIYRSKFTENTASWALNSVGAASSDPVKPLTVLETEITGNSSGAIRGVYTNIQIANSTITGNKGNNSSIGTGIYAGEGSALTVKETYLHSNKAEQAADDVYIASSVTSLSLPSVKAMNITAMNGTDETRFSLDGWYSDTESKRWTVEGAYRYNSEPAVSNTYVGDMITNMPTEDGYSLKAAYTAYDTIEVEKNWVDYDNLYSTRPTEVLATIKNNNNPVMIFALSDYSTIPATASLSSGSSWKATINPLSQATYSESPFTLIETHTDGTEISTYQPKQTWTFVEDKWTDSNNNTQSGPTGVYTAALTNTYIVPITISKVWDDADDKDSKRPALLNTELDMGTRKISVYEASDLSGDAAEVIGLSATGDWSKTVYVAADQIGTSLQAYEGKATGYTQASKVISFNSNGSVSVTFVNTHELESAAQNTVTNENMVEIHYRAEKTWAWAAGEDEAGDIPRPEITIVLKANGVEVDRGVIPADAARARYTFFNVPKYRDNHGTELIKYTITEEITDPAWVKVGSDWYSLDGKGFFTPSIIDVDTESDYDPDPLSTIKGQVTNSYQLLRKKTKVAVKKIWKDHNNENKARPDSITLGLFTPDGTSRVAVITLNNATSWEGTFELPLYDDEGNFIDYSEYILKESTDYIGDEPDTSAWHESNDSFVLSDHSFTYSYSVEKKTKP